MRGQKTTSKIGTHHCRTVNNVLLKGFNDPTTNRRPRLRAERGITAGSVSFAAIFRLTSLREIPSSTFLRCITTGVVWGEAEQQ
jgi:hypothetical protein